MKIQQLDLDGIGSPSGLVTRILQIESDLKIPVPIEDLALALGVGEIAELTTDGFVGGLLTDEVRSFGGILVAKGLNRQRRRFTIGHELGHFVIPLHRPRTGQFLCSASDLLRSNPNEQDSAKRMESEANDFAALMLMPPPALRKFLRQWSDPNLSKMIALHEHFDVSRETASRAYARFQGSKIGMIIIYNGKVARIYRSLDFPTLCIKRGDPVAIGSLSKTFRGMPGAISDIRYGDAGQWLRSEWGKRLPSLYEQVLVQSSGYATIMLWCDEPDDSDDYDPDADRTAKQRYRDRQAGHDPYRRN